MVRLDNIRVCPNKDKMDISYDWSKNEHQKIKEYFDELTRYNISLPLFLNNLKTIQICEVEDDELLKYELAVYSPYHNIIVYRKNCFDENIMHELLHMSSSYVEDNFLYCGFYQADGTSKNNIGIGITEGYTCILDKRYFCPDKEILITDSYYLLEYFASIIEDYITIERFEKYYFDADLKSLISDIASSVGERKAIKLIANLDEIFYNFYDASLYNREEKLNFNLYFKLFYECMHIIGEAFINLYTENYYLGNMNEMEYYNSLLSVQTVLERKLRMKDRESKKISKREVNKLIKLAQKKYA